MWARNAGCKIRREEAEAVEQTASKRTNPVVVGAAASVVVVSLVGIGALAGLAPFASSDRSRALPERAAKSAGAVTETPRTVARPERIGAPQLCAKCGVVESVRAFGVKGEAGDRDETVYRVTIRMDDGSYRTISHPVAPGYSIGEKVRLIDGAVVPRG